MPSPLLGLGLAGGLAAVHLVAGTLRFLDVVPRSRTLSLAGGISVAYVFVHLLPEVTAHRAALARGAESVTAFSGAATDRTAFLVALVGFVVFYGLERVTARSRRTTDHDEVAGGAETTTSAGAFWLHMGSFAAYNALVGYLLFHREETGLANLLLFATAMALHFLVNDYGLRRRHRAAYAAVGRWLLAGAGVAGALVGLRVVVADQLVGLLLAFLAGGVVLNVIKEELPEDRESRFLPFGLGVAGYTAVLVLV